MLVIGDDARTGPFGERDRRDLGPERAVLDGLAGAGQRLHRIGVLVLAGELIGLRGGLAEIAHRAAGLMGVFQPVHHHVVDDPVMAGAIAVHPRGADRVRRQPRERAARGPGFSFGTASLPRIPAGAMTGERGERESLLAIRSFVNRYVGRISTNDPCVFSNARIVEPIGC